MYEKYNAKLDKVIEEIVRQINNYKDYSTALKKVFCNIKMRKDYVGENVLTGIKSVGNGETVSFCFGTIDKSKTIVLCLQDKLGNDVLTHILKENDVNEFIKELI